MTAPRGIEDVGRTHPQPRRALRIEELEGAGDEAQARDAARIHHVAELSRGRLALEVDEVLDARRIYDVEDVGRVGREGIGVEGDAVDCGERRIERPLQGERDREARGVVAEANRAGCLRGELDRDVPCPR
ncbi:hypothetical protein BE20_00815 [Sorangium cellulosum]|uniref:Uncharacterized protein n=1 Tax=Sorangium cellulosum TaxID=56 RepID=A0A150SPC6_SORCE|nr:hypothetical protein BE18_18635 [Sorangium cellulosum]KYF94230.1 hypothetical protein BE20_00815 [Sorangium cellulosum]